MAHDARLRDRLARARLEAEALEVTELRILAELAKGRPPGPQTSLTKLLSSNLGQEIDTLRLELLGYDALQLPLERPLYGNSAPEPVGSRTAQTAMGRYLNNRASTIFGGSNEVQKNIIAKTVLGL
jgi:alkylation response protein AidB-like acyl-CoA dehydrogenase